MSEAYEARQRYSELFPELKRYLGRSWLKRDSTKFNTASAAVTSNAVYFSGLMESRTHLLDITSEHAALVRAVSCKDAHVREIVTLADGEFIPNPIVMKILADHVRRTGTPISYRVFDTSGKQLYFINDAHSTYYKPEISVLEKIKDWKPRPNKVAIDKTRSLRKQLQECARMGLETHFSSNTKTCYGAAVAAGDYIYFGGVYSSFDKRLSLHGEMPAAISAIADGNRKITHVALMSTKFVDDVPQMCGCCRQFYSEIQQKTGIPITFTGFSHDGTKEFEIPLEEYLPHGWDSGESIDCKGAR